VLGDDVDFDDVVALPGPWPVFLGQRLAGTTAMSLSAFT